MCTQAGLEGASVGAAIARDCRHRSATWLRLINTHQMVQ